jgi:hypothetical protein
VRASENPTTMAELRSLPLAALSLLASCVLTWSEDFAWNTTSAYGLERHTGAKEVVLTCPPSVTALETTLRVRCTSGTMQVRLVDPGGVACFDDQLHGGDRESRWHWPARAGQWVCELRFVDFDGDYELGLSAFTPRR